MIYFLVIFFQMADNEEPLKRYSRMRNWKDITGGDIRILFAHLLVIGVMKRANAAKYWSNCDITKLDFFGKYLSRNSYQMLISNFHCAPDFPNSG